MAAMAPPGHFVGSATGSKRPSFNRVNSPASCPTQSTPATSSHRLVTRLLLKPGVAGALKFTKRAPSKRASPL
jgi:hypothetical protein